MTKKISPELIEKPNKCQVQRKKTEAHTHISLVSLRRGKRSPLQGTKKKQVVHEGSGI